MDDRLLTPCTAFDGPRRITAGPLRSVALRVKTHLETHATGSVLVFDDETGRVVDLDTRGTPEEVVARLSPVAPPQPGEPRGRGRPKLGVVAREVTLLPRHWDWLNAQPGGASVTLRKLVEEARRIGGAGEGKRQAQDRAYRFMSALGGDEPGYEEALRALYAADRAAFLAHTQAWPVDVRDHARALAQPAFPEGTSNP
ncbi:hypothetical protein GETHOR_23220 [Geothrix oryzae]|uniref:DUF2239 family protein n=1 Tax=Geothrix oryzae TaxID=2927975 RepID=A0ABM8DT28_9BACT|nr:DUF2239 family protein [Geothrix oryzae]BDU70221.1 hypothetical protein GETHOR_23220 [Geothrix oryzae]